NPYVWQEELRELAPVVRLEQYKAYAIGRYAEIKLVLRDPVTYDNAAGIGLADISKPGSWGRKASVFSEKVGEEHARNRRVLTRILAPIVIRRWKSDFERQATETLDEIGDKQKVDGVQDIAEAFILKALPGAVGLTMTREQMNVAADLNFNQLGPNNDLLAAALRRAEPHMEWYNKQGHRGFVWVVFAPWWQVQPSGRSDLFGLRPLPSVDNMAAHCPSRAAAVKDGALAPPKACP